MTDTSPVDCPWWKPKNCWRSVDAHFHVVAWRVSLSLFPIKAANTLIIDRNDHMAFELPDLQDHTLLMLRWRSIPEWGRECVGRSFAIEASQYRIYECSQPIATQITNDGRL